MARRKKQLLDDHDSSDNSSNEEETEESSEFYQRNRKRQRSHEPSSSKLPSFVSATTTNPLPASPPPAPALLSPETTLESLPTPAEPAALLPLPFAPRKQSSRGGIGSRTAKADSNPSLPSPTPTPAPLAASAPRFASATAASHVELGQLAPTPQVDPEIITPPPQSGSASPMTGAATPRVGIGAGIGARSGIGSSKPRESLAESLQRRLATTALLDQPPPSTPSTPIPEPEAATPPPRRSFLPSAAPVSTTPLAPMSNSEKKHFAQLASSGSLGLKMLEKMGWKSGTGLGMNEQGIVTPIGEGTKVRPTKMGLAFGGHGERSSGSKEEARRRGEEQDEPESKGKGKGRRAEPKEKKPLKDAWQQPSKKREAKLKTEYKSYEEIVAESGDAPEGVGLLVDLAGNALTADSLSSLPAYGAASADPTRLPELRHNLILINSSNSSSLSALAREGKSTTERKTYLTAEELRVAQVVQRQARSMERIKGIMLLVKRIQAREKEVSDLMGAAAEEISPADALGGFMDDFDALLGTYADEYEEMRLDEAVVAAITPIIRRLFAAWDPLTDPTFAVAQLKRLRRHFLIDKQLAQSEDSMDVDVYNGSASFSNGGSSKKGTDRTMTAYETMMWTIWLPRVRSAINNAWSPSDPNSAVLLFTSWNSLLPTFLRDNVLDQLILPKLSQAISDWSPSSLKRGGAALHTIVFPWLEWAGDRMDMVLDEAKRKVRSWLKSWKVRDGVPKGMDAWKEAFSPTDWDALVLKNVLPQLGTTLREEFEVNPREQNLKPLENVLAWRTLVRSSMMSQLLEGEFFKKWLEALYTWLTHDPNFEQVAEWYTYWKSYFPDGIVALPGVSRGFRKGLDLMNQASALGDDARYRLKRPDTSIATTSKSTKSSKSTKPTYQARPAEVTFRSIVEEFAARSNLVFLATGKAHEKGFPLFRVSQSVDGKSGLTVYLDGDVVWVLEKGEWHPASIEEMAAKALR